VHVGLTSRKDFEEGVDQLLRQAPANPTPNPSVSGLLTFRKGRS